MAAKLDTEQLIRPEPESEEEHDNANDDSDDGTERAEGDGNSDQSDGEGGVDVEPQPPIGVYDHVAPQVENKKENQGPWYKRGGRAIVGCVIGCCHDCKTMDKVIFAFHILLILVGLAVGTVTTMSKMSTHNQCYLKAHYHSDGSMDYTHELYWCDSLLYDSLVTMSLAFLFIMVNWTAQLNKNIWWVWIKMGLHVAGWLLQLGSGIMLLIAFFSWCSSMESAMQDDDDHPATDDENKCLRAARYFDEDKNEESTLTHLYSITLISLGVALLAAVVWTVTLVLAIAHFCAFLYRKQDEHEDQEEDDYHLDDGDSDDDEEEGYRYPPYDENLVRQRRIAGGYNLNIQDGEEGAVGGAVGGTALGNRDIAA